MKRAMIVGGGVVGTSAALALQREGWAVTLLDRGAVGEGCSMGNAGHLGTASVLPQATPAQIRAIPRLLRDADGPLVARWGYVLRELPWFVRFIANGNEARMQANARALAALMERVPESWEGLCAEASAADLIRRTGLLHVWRGAAGFAASAWAYDLRRRLGVRVEELDGPATRRAEPALHMGIAGGRMLPDVPTVTDPLELTRRIAARFLALGGVVERAAVTDILREGNAARGVRTLTGDMEAELVVLAAGAWSARLARPHGARVPVVAERGYHIMLAGTNGVPRQPLLLAEARVAVTPMRGGLRLTSMAEFADPDAAPDHARAARVLNGAAAMLPNLGLPNLGLPGLDGEPESRWMGARPSTPDSLPVIGHAPRTRGLILAYGHGHLGMTLAGVTAEAVADLAAGRPTRSDLAACAPGRRAA